MWILNENPVTFSLKTWQKKEPKRIGFGGRRGKTLVNSMLLIKHYVKT